MTVAIDSGAYKSYRSGKMGCNAGGKNINHAVQGVGYNGEENYWIIRNSWGSGWGMGGYVFQAAGCNSLGIGNGGNSASEIQPMNPHPPPGAPPPPGIPPPPPHPPTTPPPPVHPDVLPRAKIKMVDGDLSFASTVASTLNVTDAMVAALREEQDSDPRLGGRDGFTFSAWVRRANYGSLTDTLFQLGSYTDDGSSSAAGFVASDTITLSFGGGTAATAGRRLSSASPAPGLKYVVQNGNSAGAASVLEVSVAFPPWVWVNVIVVHAEDGTASIYFDNTLVASGAVTLPTHTVRSSHVFGGSIRSLVRTDATSTLFRGIMRDVFVTAAATDTHHRNHIQTHTGPSSK